jgi:hypothetical protein
LSNEQVFCDSLLVSFVTEAPTLFSRAVSFIYAELACFAQLVKGYCEVLSIKSLFSMFLKFLARGKQINVLNSVSAHDDHGCF